MHTIFHLFKHNLKCYWRSVSKSKNKYNTKLSSALLRYRIFTEWTVRLDWFKRQRQRWTTAINRWPCLLPADGNITTCRRRRDVGDAEEEGRGKGRVWGGARRAINGEYYRCRTSDDVTRRWRVRCRHSATFLIFYPDVFSSLLNSATSLILRLLLLCWAVNKAPCWRRISVVCHS